MSLRTAALYGLALGLLIAIGFSWRGSRKQFRRRQQWLAFSQLARSVFAADDTRTIETVLNSQGGAVFRGAEFQLFLLKELASGSMRREQFMDGKALVWTLPLVASRRPLGLLKVRYPGKRRLQLEEEALIDHLATIVTAAMQVQDQAVMRETVRRSEQMAIAGQLISAIAHELQDPIEWIRSQSGRLLERSFDSLTEHELRSISNTATQAGDTVARLISFSRKDRGEVSTFDFNLLLRNMLQFRDPEFRLKSIEVDLALNREPLLVAGIRAQLEEALLQIVFLAERAAGRTGKQIAARTLSASGFALLYLQFPASQEEVGEDAQLSLGRSLVQAHGGDLTVRETNSGRSGGPWVEVELRLPLTAETEAPAEAKPVSQLPLTVLLVEPDEPSRRQILCYLSEHGHRAIPVTSAEEAVDLLRRLRFDVVLCAARLPGMKWIDFFETARQQARSFVLITESIDPTLGLTLRGAEAHSLRSPVDPKDLAAVLEAISTNVPLGYRS